MIWGLKSLACFDVWSFEHFFSGVSIDATLLVFMERRLKIDAHDRNHAYIYFSGLLVLTYCWETVEHYLETGLLGAGVSYWFQGVEFWANRMITDPLLNLAGAWVARRAMFIVKGVRLFIFIWLGIHIFVFPHSMYLHELGWF